MKNFLNFLDKDIFTYIGYIKNVNVHVLSTLYFIPNGRN